MRWNASGHRPKLCNPLRSQAAHGPDQQDRQAGCQRAGDPAAQRDSAGSLDSAGRVARSTRAAAPANLPGAAAHASEESDSRDAGPAQRAGTGNRSFRRRSPTGTWHAAPGVAHPQPGNCGGRAGGIGFSGSANRIGGTASGSHHDGEPGGRSAEDAAVRGQDSQHGS